MIDFKMVPYEDKDNCKGVYFLNPAVKELKQQVISLCCNFSSFEEITELIEFLKELKTESLVKQKSALLISNTDLNVFRCRNLV